jgi:hypothetical protein
MFEDTLSVSEQTYKTPPKQPIDVCQKTDIFTDRELANGRTS